MCAMYSSAAIPPRLCWTGQLTEQVSTARSCTCTAQRATSCGAARMGSGGTLSTIIKARRCDIPPDVYLNVVRVDEYDKGPSGNATDFPIFSKLSDDQI